MALVAAPLAVVGTGLSAQLTFPYLSLVYRSHLFAHLPLLALAGAGIGLAVPKAANGGANVDGTTGKRESWTRRRWLPAGLIVGVVAAALVSAPIAYAGLEVRTYKSVTPRAEFASTEFATAHVDRWATDDHLARIAGYHGGGAT